MFLSNLTPFPPLDNIQVMVIVWRLSGNIIRTAVCLIVLHNVHSQQHTYMSSSYRSNRLHLSHWDLYAVCRGGCLELYYCNMVEWFWWDSSLILTTNWFPSVLWHCCFGHLACKNRPWNDYYVLSGTLSIYTTTQSGQILGCNRLQIQLSRGRFSVSGAKQITSVFLRETGFPVYRWQSCLCVFV